MSILQALKTKAGVSALLSSINSNPKVAKNDKLGVTTAVLHLAPGDMSGREVCPMRSPGCTAACLHFAGSPAYMTNKTQARLKKTELFFRDREAFMNLLAYEIEQHLRRAKKLKMEPAVRLNGTSDLRWEKITFTPEPALLKKIGRSASGRVSIIELFSDVKFYDYTKIPNRKVPDNYYLIFSLAENNETAALDELSRGRNVAVVFPTKTLPETFTLGHLTLPVISGDEHDYRPADPLACFVGLKVKGVKGKADATGFVVA